MPNGRNCQWGVPSSEAHGNHTFQLLPWIRNSSRFLALCGKPTEGGVGRRSRGSVPGLGPRNDTSSLQRTKVAMASQLRGRERCCDSRRWDQKCPFKCHPAHGEALAFLPQELSNPIKRPFSSPVWAAHTTTCRLTLLPVTARTSSSWDCGSGRVGGELGAASPRSPAPRLSPSWGAPRGLTNYRQSTLSVASCCKHTRVSASILQNLGS